MFASDIGFEKLLYNLFYYLKNNYNSTHSTNNLQRTKFVKKIENYVKKSFKRN